MTRRASTRTASSPWASTARACAAALLCIAATGCDVGPQGIADTWLLEVWISSPHRADQAILVTFHDPVERFDPAPGVRHFLDASHGASTILVVADWPLPAGETLVGSARLRARSRASLPTARVSEVARSDFQLRESVADYRVRLVPQGR
jgi:hypothetical protein